MGRCQSFKSLSLDLSEDKWIAQIKGQKKDVFSKRCIFLFFLK